MAALKNQPVAASIRVGETCRDYEGGIFKGRCGEEGSHAVTIVGYGGTDSGELYWIVKNSWAENGYIRLSRTDPDGLGGGIVISILVLFTPWRPSSRSDIPCQIMLCALLHALFLNESMNTYFI